MNHGQHLSRLKRFQELLLTTFLGDIPTIFGGVKLRNFLYHAIFSRIGSSVYLQDGVEFLGADAI